MADLFSTDVLTAVVQSLLGNPQFLLDRYFGTTQSETSEQIHFDTIQGKRRVAPVVSPLVEGQIVAHLGYTSQTYTPAYVKDKRVFDANRPLKRSPGEQIGGTLTPMDRLRALVAQDTQDQLNMLRRRLEVWCGQCLATGKLTIQGTKYPMVQLDYGRDPTNTVVASPLWSVSTSLPLDNLQDWSQHVLQLTGAEARDVLMPVPVWKVFRANPQVTSALQLWRTYQAYPTMAGDAQIQEGGVLMGQVEGFNFWVYAGWYVDDTGTEQPILPQNSIILTSPNLEGVQAYGAIRDETAGIQAVPYYVKSWIEPDPAVRFMMLQSAPLIVPYRPNASFAAQVI